MSYDPLEERALENLARIWRVADLDDCEDREDLLIAFLCESDNRAGAWAVASPETRASGALLTNLIEAVCQSPTMQDDFVSQVQDGDYESVAQAIREALAYVPE